MRIELPTSVPVGKALLFSSVLVLVELLEGTNPYYSALVFCFVMLSVFGFNVAGGFSRPSGAYIAFYSTLAGIVGTVYKGLLGQAADTNLASPLLTMSVYTGTAAALLVAAFLTRKVATTTEGIAAVMKVPQIDFAASALGCVVVVFLINNAFVLFPAGAGSILHAIALVNNFLPLGILLGTIAAVQNSNGRHSTSPLVIGTLVYATYYGLLSFSKQGMFSPFVCWVLGLLWARFRLRQRHILAIIAFSVIAQMWMTPLANVGRGEAPGGTTEERQALTEHYIEHPMLLRERNRERQNSYLGSSAFYFRTPQGIFDRFTMLPNDAQLIDLTANGKTYGLLPLLYYYQNWVPHILAPNKLQGVTLGGNVYAHELGWVSDEDWTTGISFSPSAEAFHLGGWFCVLILQPIIFTISFIIFDGVNGDLRRQPWGLLPMLLFAHVAPEGLLAALIESTFRANVGIVFAIFVCGFVAPVFGELVRGRSRAPARRNLVTAPVLSAGEAT